jgi:tight adherence protein B
VSDLSVIFALIFVAASLAIYGVYWIFVFNRRAHKMVNRRLDLSKSLDDSSVVLETLRRERGFRNDTNPILRHFSDWLTQTGIRVQRMSLVLVFIALCLALTFAFGLILGMGLISLALAVFAAAALIILYLSRKRSRRIFAFSEQLADAIDVIVRGVRVGLPFSSAVTLAAREMPDPVGTEFGMLADEIAFGLDLRTALQNLYRRVGQEDLLFLTVALTIQTQTGGNIGEVLTRLSRLMRNRAEMRLKVRALTSEGRASAFVLSAFPLVLVAVVYFISPSFFDSVRSPQILGPAVGIALFMLIVGNIIMYRLVNFKY